MGREQRTVFGGVPELYDRAQAPYADALIDDVVAFARGDKAPPRFVPSRLVCAHRQGHGASALEPDEAMAAVARRNGMPWPQVAVEVNTFEGWPPESDQRFDLSSLHRPGRGSLRTSEW